MIDNFEEIKDKALNEAQEYNSSTPLYICASKQPWSPDKYEIWRVPDKSNIRGIYIGYYCNNKLVEDELSDEYSNILDSNNLYNNKIIENEKFISDQLEAICPKHSLLHKFGKWITDNFY